VVPGIIADAGQRAARRFLEFFAATIRNRNTRAAYMVAVSRFFAWCEQHRIGELADIEPLHVAAYIEMLGQNLRNPRSSSTWQRSACCSTGWSPARSSPLILPTPCAVRNM
jgi:site-specific recombinase XerD